MVSGASASVEKTQTDRHGARFFPGLASLGGFLCRKSDGEPGWQTVWSGLETLLQCLRGAEALGKRCG